VPVPDLTQVRKDCTKVKKLMRALDVPQKLINSIETKALRTGRKITGEHKTNREQRWSISTANPQYASELDSRVIFVKLCAMIFEFTHAPKLDGELRTLLEVYLEKPIKRGRYKDALLLEALDYRAMRDDAIAPTHGASVYHIGHENPTLTPRHVPGNISWRTSRSNLIQGDMTLRQSRIYLLKLIGRYFELGELDIE
jgi:hypothetical protein